jgi:hypothetical protein
MPSFVPENRAAKKRIEVAERLGKLVAVSCGSDAGVGVDDLFLAHEEAPKVRLNDEDNSVEGYDDGVRVILRAEIVHRTLTICSIIQESTPGMLVAGDPVIWRPR